MSEWNLIKCIRNKENAVEHSISHFFGPECPTSVILFHGTRNSLPVYFECCSLYRIQHNETWNLAIFQCARAEWIQYTQIMWRNGFQQVSIFQPTICAHLIYVHHDLHRTWNSCIMFRVHRILWQILLKSWKVNQKFATRLVDNG